MSKEELHILIEQRTLGADCRLLRRHCALQRRDLAGPVVIACRSLLVPQRLLVGPVHIHGHSFAALEPVLMTGPSAVPSITTAMIYWTTDIPAYHRVRTRTNPTGAWTEWPWTLTPSTNAVYSLSGLSPENVQHYTDVQSCVVGDGSAAFAWTPGDNSFHFSTLCSGTYGMAGWNASKHSMGPLDYLRLSWTTTVAMYQAQIDSTTPALCYGPWSSGGPHFHEYVPFDFSKAGTYYWRTRNRNMCYDWCSYSAYKYFTVGRAGTIIAQG